MGFGIFLLESARYWRSSTQFSKENCITRMVATTFCQGISGCLTLAFRPCFVLARKLQDYGWSPYANQGENKIHYNNFVLRLLLFHLCIKLRETVFVESALALRMCKSDKELWMWGRSLIDRNSPTALAENCCLIHIDP